MLRPAQSICRLPLTLTLVLFLYLFAVTALAATHPSPSSLADGPSTNDDQICTSADPKSCYPRVFVPTINFQPIREGQSIPPGLHIRLNVQTGEKEARLNVPMEGALEDSLESLFLGQGMKMEMESDMGSALLEVPQPDEETIGKDELR